MWPGRGSSKMEGSGKWSLRSGSWGSIPEESL